MEILDARFVAECLINFASQSPENDMTNMKLQKLLYYVQGTCLALHGQRMFAQDIEKWQYGPVVPDAYHAYKGYGSQVIDRQEPIDFAVLDPRQYDVLTNVYEFFGQFSAIKLMNLTHEESPWNSVAMNDVIPIEIIHDFFKTIVVDNG
jgi:uncharacterized phage-associated protein